MLKLGGGDDGLKDEMAEREGFEPPLGCPKPDFESGTFGHSDTSPFLHSILLLR